MDNYQCPKCHSNRVKVGYPDIECLACGWSEPLIDFPISWDFHRSLCLEYGLPDPGPCEPPEHDVEELHKRISALEENVQPYEKLKYLPQKHEKPKPKLAGGVRL